MNFGRQRIDSDVWNTTVLRCYRRVCFLHNRGRTPDLYTGGHDRARLRCLGCWSFFWREKPLYTGSFEELGPDGMVTQAWQDLGIPIPAWICVGALISFLVWCWQAPGHIMTGVPVVPRPPRPPRPCRPRRPPALDTSNEELQQLRREVHNLRLEMQHLRVAL